MVSKGGFPFASPMQIPMLTKNLETETLKRYTPFLHAANTFYLLKAITRPDKDVLALSGIS